MQIAELIQRAGKTAKEKGWWDKPRDFAHVCALWHSEISEALEHARKGHKIDQTWLEGLKPEGVLVDVADLYIRVADWLACHNLGDEFEKVLERKLNYNDTRERRHGKVF